MSTHYFYGDAEHNEHGPYSEAQIREMARSGRLTLATPIYIQGSGHWKPLSEFPHLLRRSRRWMGWAAFVLLLAVGAAAVWKVQAGKALALKVEQEKALAERVRNFELETFGAKGLRWGDELPTVRAKYPDLTQGKEDQNVWVFSGKDGKAGEKNLVFKEGRLSELTVIHGRFPKAMDNVFGDYVKTYAEIFGSPNFTQSRSASVEAMWDRPGCKVSLTQFEFAQELLVLTSFVKH